MSRSLIIVVAIALAMSCVHCLETDAFEGIVSHHAAIAWERYQALVLNKADLDAVETRSQPASHTCTHDLHVAEPAISAQPSSGHEKRQSRTWQPISIQFETSLLTTSRVDVGETCYTTSDSYFDLGTTHTCEASNLINDASISVVKDTVLPFLQSVIESIYMVSKPAGGDTIRLSGSCSGVPVPAAWQNPGTSADFTLFASLRALATSSATGRFTVLATASTCQVGPAQAGRPVVGFVTFNPAEWRVLPTNQLAFETQLRVALHELHHALGFSATQFDQYLNQPTTKSVYGANDLVRTLFIGTRATAAARAQFGCSTLQGAELEEVEGSGGTRASHWEERIFGDELMTGFSARQLLLSDMTVSAMEDSGWYKRQTSAVLDYNPWGAGLGCQFASDTCSADTWPGQLGYWCEKQSEWGCAPGLRVKARCNWVTFTADLPTPFRYSPTDPRRGGANNFADFCPYYDQTAGDAVYCIDTDANTDGGSKKEVFGPSSYCLPITSSAKVACYKVEVSGASVTVSNSAQQSVTCPADGGYVSLGSETVYCPTADFLSADPLASQLPPASAFFGGAAPSSEASRRVGGAITMVVAALLLAIIYF